MVMFICGNSYIAIIPAAIGTLRLKTDKTAKPNWQPCKSNDVLPERIYFGISDCQERFDTLILMCPWVES